MEVLGGGTVASGSGLVQWLLQIPSVFKPEELSTFQSHFTAWKTTAIYGALSEEGKASPSSFHEAALALQEMPTS